MVEECRAGKSAVRGNGLALHAQLRRKKKKRKKEKKAVDAIQTDERNGPRLC